MAYQAMAKLYDMFMDEAPYGRWAEFIQEIFSHSSTEIKDVVDLGCGTGEITTRLATRGYTMTGVDYSEDMLSLAQQKAAEDRNSIQWLHQDLRALDGLSELDAAVSCCDVINYITDEEDLKNVFKRIANCLKDGGLFVFDVHSMNHVKNHLVNQTFADVTDQASYIWFCIDGEENGEMYHELTFFISNGGYYQRFDEYHHQRTYPVNFYKKILHAAGFENIKLYADFSLNEENLNQEAERIFFSAKKRPGES